jgi:hypothetical protein
MNIFGELLRDNKFFLDYKNWLMNAQPKEKYTYYTGNALSESKIGEMIGRVVMQDAMEGFVYLVQKKRGDYLYEHIAIKVGTDPNMKLVPTFRYRYKGD